MRTCDRALGIVLLGVGLGLAPALGFDGTTNRAQLQSLPSPAAPLHPGETPRGTANITSLEYAAERGDSTAQWRLGQIYMKGEGVPRSDVRAFGYFGKIASRADDGIDSRNAPIVASAIVAVGRYYLDGIPDSDIKADPVRARRLFFYAASNFRDPDAQYLLGRLLLD